jgi:hypothetical protein
MPVVGRQVPNSSQHNPKGHQFYTHRCENLKYQQFSKILYRRLHIKYVNNHKINVPFNECFEFGYIGLCSFKDGDLLLRLS